MPADKASKSSIKLIVKGETPSMLDAEKANEVITALNALRAIKIVPEGYGKITLGDGNAVLDLSLLATVFAPALITTPTTAGPGGGSGGVASGDTAIILQMLSCFRITPECNADGTLAVNWSFVCP